MDAAQELERLRKNRGVRTPEEEAERMLVRPDPSGLSVESEEARQRREAAQRERLRLRLRAEALAEASMMPRRHLHTLMEGEPTWPDPAVAEGVWDAASRRQSVVLLADRGRGKTLLACWVGVRACRAGVGVRYWRAADLLADIRHRCYTGGESEHAVLRGHAAHGLLVVDEFHERTGRGEFELPMMTRVIDHRYAEMRPTLIVTNHASEAEFERAVGPSVMSRLQETGVIVDLGGWPDFRAGATA